VEESMEEQVSGTQGVVCVSHEPQRRK